MLKLGLGARGAKNLWGAADRGQLVGLWGILLEF